MSGRLYRAGHAGGHARAPLVISASASCLPPHNEKRRHRERTNTGPAGFGLWWGWGVTRAPDGRDGMSMTRGWAGGEAPTPGGQHGNAPTKC